MNVFDTHLHLPSPNPAGVEAFNCMIEAYPGFQGGLLILNTPVGVEAILAQHARLDPRILLVPFFDPENPWDGILGRSKWVKIHPTYLDLGPDGLQCLIAALDRQRPVGVVVHHFPWGPDLRKPSGLEWIVRIAKTLPWLTVLATHGGGYESWALRAHAGPLPNVHFDFSCALHYYEGSDLLRPLIHYFRHSPERVHFGSDWPDAPPGSQLKECLRLGSEAGLDAHQVESLLLRNANRLWPMAFPGTGAP